MTASSYDAALERVLVHEGGYTNHPSDPGGPTNWGITIHDARAHWKKDATAVDVRGMPLAVAKQIYRSKYWDALRCDDLPAGVDYAVFDYGVNSGIGRAGKALRRVLGLSDKAYAVTADVIAAARRHEPKALVNAICDERLAFLQGLRTWSVFGRGWGRRVREVRVAALAMANKKVSSPTTAAPAPAPKSGVPPKGQKPAVPAKRLGLGAAVVAALVAGAQWIDAHPLLTIGALVAAALVDFVLIHRLKKGN
jgi:lysozyme family protein